MPLAPAADAALASSLRIAVARLARRLRAQRSDDSLSPSQLAALATLERHGPLTPTELAAHEKVQPPSMTRIVSAIEAHGLASRTAHPTDRRQAVVAITAAGSGRLQADRRHRDAWLSRRLAELDPEELAALRAAASVLERLSQS
ncbi:MAG: MarR family transcriptional regulator [Acidimicrobiales bacterium]